MKNTPWNTISYRWSQMPQNIFTMVGQMLSEYLHHGWGKFWTLIIWNAQEWSIWTTYLRMSSPWLKKILDYDDLKCPRMKDLIHLSRHIFTMVEENFGFRWSEMPKNEGFDQLISKYLHHGWRKFWTLMIWNFQEWSIWTTYLRLYSP